MVFQIPAMLVFRFANFTNIKAIFLKVLGIDFVVIVMTILHMSNQRGLVCELNLANFTDEHLIDLILIDSIILNRLWLSSLYFSLDLYFIGLND
jgi:hypothetical protein